MVQFNYAYSPALYIVNPQIICAANNHIIIAVILIHMEYRFQR